MLPDQFFMQVAIQEAWKYQCLTYPNPAVGCVITQNGSLLAIEAHRKAGESHAEVLAMASAYEMLSGRPLPIEKSNAQMVHEFMESLPNDFFSSCTMYVTLEPCSHSGKTPSCAELIGKMNFKRVIMGMFDPIKEHSGGAEILVNFGIDVDFDVGKKEAENLIEPFLIWQKRAFVLFKLAQTSNGRIGGGYLSSKESLEHVHRLRHAVDRLVIGGNTVRTDRPVLDCRFACEAPPDVTIYSKKDDFDRSIPLFGIPEREVLVSDTLEFLDDPSFLLVEGGEGMLRALSERIDWLLLYQTPKLSTDQLSYNVNKNLEFLHEMRMGADLMIWSRFG